jgi:hypothetical protein
MIAKLKAIRVELQRRKHDRMAEVGGWLRKVVLGYYLHTFSSDVADIFERFEMPAQIDRLQKADLLYLVTEKFASIGWSQCSSRYSTTAASLL